MEDGTTNSVYDCQIYFPSADEATEGYAAFLVPGFFTTYYIASFLPTVEDLSLAKTQSLMLADGATSVTTYCAAVLAAIYALAF